MTTRVEGPQWATLTFDVPEDFVDLCTFALFEHGAEGVEERDETTMVRSFEGASPDSLHRLIAHFPNERAAHEAAGELRDYQPRVELSATTEWAQEWKKYWKPMPVGQRFVIKPTWCEFNATPDQIVLEIDPENAFGTGLHETTRLVLRAIEPTVSAGDVVIDVGCGSGILAIGALKLGARRAHACDVDIDAVLVADNNAKINDVADRMRTWTGSIDMADPVYDVVLANIHTWVLERLHDDLVSRVRPGGHLVLSGILDHEHDRVRDAYADLQWLRTDSEGEWVALTFTRPTAGNS